jgi:alanine racemase
VRPTIALVDLDAITANVRMLRARAPDARFCAVVKADGYGHGAVPVARAALRGGADWLAVALVEEAAALRDADITAPILLLSEPPADAFGVVADLDLRPTLYTAAGVDACSQHPGRPVHLKVDTGMNRVGAAPGDVVHLTQRILTAGLHLEGVWTHCAVADDPDDPFTAEQTARFDAVLASLAAAGIHPELAHQANSAAALAHPVTRRDLVRVGIAVYGIAPSPELDDVVSLTSALTVQSAVSFVKRVPAGEGISYGLTHRFARPTTVATVPIGYADGVPRRLSSTGGQVLHGGRRRGIVGVVTMDQLMIDCGDAEVAVGDEVVLLGRQGDERITPWEWATRLDTIAYEIVCGIGPRVPRVHRGEPA